MTSSSQCLLLQRQLLVRCSYSKILFPTFYANFSTSYSINFQFLISIFHSYILLQLLTPQLLILQFLAPSPCQPTSCSNHFLLIQIFAFKPKISIRLDRKINMKINTRIRSRIRSLRLPWYSWISSVSQFEKLWSMKSPIRW